MSETTIVNLLTIARVLVVGGILLVIPRVTRKGLLFGAYVGEELAERDEARRLRVRWNRGCLTWMGLSLVVGLGLSLAGRPIAGNYAATALLLFAAIGLYLRLYYAARALVPAAAARQAEVAAAPIEHGKPKGETLAKVALGICLLAGLATVAHSMLSYDALPQRFPTHFNAAGEADRWADRSVASVLLLPSMNLVISPFIALMALLTTRAKRSLRGGSGGRSLEAQEGFRSAVANLLSGTALLTCLLLTFISVQVIRIGSSQARSLGPGILWIAGLMLLFLLGAVIRIIVKYGQGGARVEEGSAEARLTDGLADNAHWVLGVFYVNRTDPSFLVEKRFGIGYTINFGNRKAVGLLAVFLALFLGLTVIGLVVGRP